MRTQTTEHRLARWGRARPEDKANSTRDACAGCGTPLEPHETLRACPSCAAFAALGQSLIEFRRTRR